jgi:hypothetical protein
VTLTAHHHEDYGGEFVVKNRCSGVAVYGDLRSLKALHCYGSKAPCRFRGIPYSALAVAEKPWGFRPRALHYCEVANAE